MSEYLVAIAEGPNTRAGELDMWLRLEDLPAAGFRQDHEIPYDEAMARGDESFEEIMQPNAEPISLDAPAFRRIVYRYETESAEQAVADARAIVDGSFNIRAVKAPA